MTNTQYELTLQSLIDGELSLAERNAFLKSIAIDDAERWRSIAMTFIEERVWQADLCPAAAGETIAEPVPAAGVRSKPVAANSITPAVRTSPRQQVAGRHTGGSLWNRQLATLAMSVLLTAAVCFFWGHASGREAGFTAAQSLELQNGMGDSLGGQANDNGPAATLAIFSKNPAVIDPWLTEPWAADLRTRWLQAGYVVNPRPVPVSVKLPGGGTADVILSDPEVQYVGNSAFQ